MWSKDTSCAKIRRMSLESPKFASAGAVLRRYWSATRHYPWSLVLVFVSAIVMQIANLTSPLYMRQFFNILSGQTGTNPTSASLLSLIVVIGALLLLNWVMTRVQNIANLYMQSRVMQDLYSQAFEYLLDHSYTFFISHFAGSLTHRVSRFARAYEILLDAILLQFFPTALFVVGAVTILAIHNLVLGAMLGAWAVLFLILQIVLARRRQPYRAERAEADSRVTGALADAISNQSAIQLFSGNEYEQRTFGNIVELWHHATLRVWYADEFIWAALGLFFIVINVALLVGATIFWQRGELTVGD